METMTDKRTARIGWNILASFFLKGWSGVVQLMLVPLTLTCLGSYSNGIWMTIASMFMWIENFDVGLGNGLRNKLAEASAEGRKDLGRIYVSTTFVMLAGIMTAVSLLVYVLAETADVASMLNVDGARVPDIAQVLAMSLIITCITFVFRLTSNVYLALQLPAVNNAIVVLGQTLTLASVWWLAHEGNDSLYCMAVAYTVSPLVINIVAFVYTFMVRYPWLRPSPRLFRREYVSSLMSLGVKFFVIQVASIVLFMSSNLVVSNLFSPDAVTPYQVANRLYSLALIVFSLVVTPYWSATTDAWQRGDVDWIAKAIIKLRLSVLVIGIGLAVMVLLGPWIFRLWVGEQVEIPFLLSALMAAYIFVVIYSQAYSFLLNGMGFLNRQLLMTVIAAVLFIPAAYVAGRLIGLPGVCLALIVVNFPGLVVNVLQFNSVIRKRKRAGTSGKGITERER